MHLVLALLACAGRPTTTAPETVSTPPAVEAPAPAAVERQTLTLDPEELRWDETAGTLTFTPGSRVQSASYTTYVFDLASAKAVLGQEPTAPVDVVVEISSETTERYTPEDPNMPAPMGGFEYITRKGKVIARAD